MSDQMAVFKSEQFGEIRTVMVDNEPWFVGKDVAVILGYSNPSEAIADHVMDDDKLNSKTLSSCQIELGQRGGWLINESGLYSLILGSKLPTAREFKHWITSDVLPTIRKTGGYVANDRLFIDTYLPGANQQTVMLFEAILGQVRNLNAEKAKLMADNEEMKPKAQFADKICKSHDNILLRAMAKLLCDEGFNIGEKRIFSLLRDKKVLMKNNEPYQTYVDRGYFVVDECSYETPYGARLGHTTKITPAGQVWLVNKCAEWHV